MTRLTAMAIAVAVVLQIAPGAILAAPAAGGIQESHRRIHPVDSRVHRTGTGVRLDAGGVPVSITFRPYMGSTRAFLDAGTAEHPCTRLSDPELVLPLGEGRTLSVRFYRRGTWLISRRAVSRLPIGSSFRFTLCDRRQSIPVP
ncbi:hypothetical protein [Sphingomonas sp. Ant20]|jgi:hypothetical protein|uniref:hypothetical protein n=1 Tax=Sphingomonas sp. Ant20 TaxID=104605 RepID=UPI0005365B3D|nr:hypothetical protein [Sphingomonas sp. Ant20]KHA63834.1 hypothetical protein NI18_13305 [Sphingomonas sp. Ant20]